MTIEYWLGLGVSLLIAGFLVYALVRPERF